MNEHDGIKIDSNLCKGCMLCVNVCNFGVLAPSGVRGKQGYLLPQVADVSKCKKCRLCEMTCPDFAIEVIKLGGETK